MINLVLPSRYKLDRKQVKDLANNFLTEKGYPDSTLINLIFIGKNKMKSIAKKYKQEDEALPVLSFLYQEKKGETNIDHLLGEVFVCYPQAVLMAAHRNKKVDNIIAFLVKHGIENITK